MLTLTQIVILAVVQGLAELLPISSSAHVIVAAKLMHKDPASAQFTLLLVMLHTGTMFAVIVYFWDAWKRAFFSSLDTFVRFATKIIIATGVTGVIGLAIIKGIEKYIEHKHPEKGKAEIESLFSHLDLLAIAMAAAGVLILFSAIRAATRRQTRKGITNGDSVAIGAIQGLCLPFRGFSRSGATISVGLMRGMTRQRAEEFSFALAVAITPFVLGKEIMRLITHHGQTTQAPIGADEFLPSLLGMIFSFVAGLIALRILSKLIEHGQWWIFGVYCLAGSAGIYWLHLRGY